MPFTVGGPISFGPPCSDRTNKNRAATALAIATVLLGACTAVKDDTPPKTPVALKVAAAPDMNALAADAVWASARPLTIKLGDGDGVDFAGGSCFIRRGDEVSFDDSRFKAGDEVAARISNVLQGDRADVRVVVAWKDGMHTSVMSRKLVTGSRFDVQWSDLDARYPFGFAAFDNAQVLHATADDVMFLTFGK